MSIVFLSRMSNDDAQVWLAALRAALPGEVVTTEIDMAAEVAVVANPPPGLLAQMPALRFIQSGWAGIDGLLADPTLPRHLPLARLIDPHLATAMAESVVAHALALHRQLPTYRTQQTNALWRPWPQIPAAQRPVGLLGYGEMGRASAEMLRHVGFPVSAWSRSHGDLDALLAQSDIVVNLLPLTPATRGVLSKPLFDRMRPGAALVSLGRGGHLVEADLLEALDEGRLSHAVLDVFGTEPLPASHRFWSHRGVTVTPHVAAVTEPVNAARAAAANIARFRAGQPVEGAVSLDAGY